MRKTVFLPMLLCMGLSAVGGEAVKFTQKPSAKKNGDKVVVSFALSRETDAAVYVLSAKGEIVRHLAAGVLGKNAPEPLKPGLAQSIEWDVKDDLGKPAAGGPFKVRVTAGTKPELDGFLLYNRDGANFLKAAAVGPKGEVYVFYNAPAMLTGGGNKIKVLDRDGKHARMIMPFPADIEPERIKACDPMLTKDGQLVPKMHGYHQTSFHPLPPGIANARGHTTPSTFSPAVDGKGRVYWLTIGARLACLDADGGVPHATFLGPRLLPEIKDLSISSKYLAAGAQIPCLAASGDGKWLYISGLRAGNGRKKLDKPIPCVFRVDLATRAGAEVFLGKKDSPGKEKGLLTHPRGVAVAKGLVYVADAGADRIAAFREADGAYVGEVKVKAPDTIGVDAGSGAIYAVSGTSIRKPDLVKIVGLKSGKMLYKIALPNDRHANRLRHTIAVDASQKPVRIWLPGKYSWTPQHGLLCVEDTGKAFESRGDLRSKDPSGALCYDMSVDRLRDELYVKINGRDWYRLDEKTGKVKGKVSTAGTPISSSGAAAGTQLVAAPDGTLYTWSWKYGLLRYDRSFSKPVKWPGRDTHAIPMGAAMSFMTRQLAVTPKGELLTVTNASTYPAKILSKPELAKQVPKGAGYIRSVDRLGFDGRIEKTFVWCCTSGAVLRTDLKGNIYLAEMIRPPDRSFPEFFDGKLPAPKREQRDASWWTSYSYGSIVKFPPSGGSIWFAGDYHRPYLKKPPAGLLAKPRVKLRAHLVHDPFKKVEMQGALWYRFGFSPFTCIGSSGGDVCMCEGPGFDVDAFGRVFFPNCAQFRAEMVDTGGNPICVFGGYGNQDSEGAKGQGRVKKPEVPFAWPMTVAVSDTHVYVGDRINQRVVKVKLATEVDETCGVK